MSFILSFINDYAALIVACLALWASWRANSHAKVALEKSVGIKLLDLQEKVINEINRQHSELNSLLVVMDELRGEYEEQRKISEKALGEGSIKKQHEVLALTRKLTFHVSEAIKEEGMNLERLINNKK